MPSMKHHVLTRIGRTRKRLTLSSPGLSGHTAAGGDIAGVHLRVVGCLKPQNFHIQRHIRI